MTRWSVRILMIVLVVGLLTPVVMAKPMVLRLATFNIEDVRAEDVRDPSNVRLRRIAEVIQRIRPNVLLLNEIAYGDPDDAEAGSIAALFVENFLSLAQGPGLSPMKFDVFDAPTNTGAASGSDLDRSGETVTEYPWPSPRRQDDEGRAYGGDAWGFGTFPGQYAMALLVDPRLSVQHSAVRTFRLFPWSRMPNNLMPNVPDEDEPWYAGETGELFRLSSKSHWDVPIELPNGAVIRVLASHPTPPAFDGDEARNKRRNHDEIRFWADYLAGALYITDDAGRAGGIRPGTPFVVMGDLNADPRAPRAGLDPMKLLQSARGIGPDPKPSSEVEVERLDEYDTARFGLRVDYVLPSADLNVVRSGIWRFGAVDADGVWTFPSDHFPVWADVVVPSP